MNKRLSFAGLFILLLSAEMSGRTLLASHHKAQIAFTSTRDGNPEIYVMDADGEKQIRLTRHPEEDKMPSWSPDGKKIAFVSMRNSSRNQIYVMDSIGENIRRITEGAFDLNPVWSPDGGKIAFSVLGDANSFIVATNTDGSDRKRLPGEALDGVPVLNSYPAWSPDGAKIAYYSGIRGEDKASIHLMTADGKHLKRLTNVPRGYDYDPDWFDPASLAVSPASNQLTIWGKLKKSAANLR